MPLSPPAEALWQSLGVTEAEAVTLQELSPESGSVLSGEEAAGIVRRLAGREISPWMVQKNLGGDAGVPLYCVLYGLALRHTARANPAREHLIASVLEVARHRACRELRDWDKILGDFRALGMKATDAGGAPVEADAASLACTHLVASEGGRVFFPVTLLRHWFAALALEEGLVKPDDVLPRIEHWLEPLAIFCALSDFKTSLPFLDPLASTNPALAARVIAAAIAPWSSLRERTEPLTLPARIHSCLSAWLRGLGPLAAACSFTDEQGHLLKLRAGERGGRTMLTFAREATLPDASELPRDLHGNIAALHLLQRTGEPAQLWRQTMDLIAQDLRRAGQTPPF